MTPVGRIVRSGHATRSDVMLGCGGCATYRGRMEIVIGLAAAWVVGAGMLTVALCRAAALGDLAFTDREPTHR